ncbi:Wzz/FepE/Etk N-terminal domain-containing protein [Deltaproteobacteria bacterium]|nr:Wzz/FepE/Etk N-terminal domain-containing protein [Deltaproteobacteria bacterium]
MPTTDSKPTSDNPQTKAPQNVKYVAPYPQQFEDDTIDLYELWITLWNKKWLVIAVTVFAALGSVVYALLAPQIYKAEALLLPPKSKDVKSLYIRLLNGLDGEKGVMQGVRSVQGLSVDGAFASFQKNLSSRTLQKKFIDKQDLMDILAPNRTPETRDIEILESFSKMMKIEDKEGISVSTESDDPEFAAKLVNDYVRYFDLETVRALVSDARNTIEEQIMDIENKIDSKRQMAKLRREDQINEIEYSISSKRELAKKRRDDKIIRIKNIISAKREGAQLRRDDQVLRFKEAIVIADSLGIKRRQDATSFFKSSQMNLDIITSTNPLYYAGTQSLQAEIKILQKRESDDPFIPELRDLQEQLTLLNAINSDDPFIDGLRDLQEKLARLRSIKSDDPFIPKLRDLQEQLLLLRSIKITEKGMHSVTVDQAAYPPKNRIKPNRRLIVSLGTVVGFFLGIFLVFLVSFVEKQRETHS